MESFKDSLIAYLAATRKSPIAPDIDFGTLASITEGFSGADITELCKRAAKYAIKESLKDSIDKENQKSEEEMLGENMDEVVEEPDTVPFITREHFEFAIQDVRPSINPGDAAQYEVSKQSRQHNKLVKIPWPESHQQQQQSQFQAKSDDVSDLYD